MKKEFELSAKLNTADFDRSIDAMVKKLKDVAQPVGTMGQATNNRAAQAGVNGMSATSMEAFQKATQGARRELDQVISSAAKSQQALGKLIADRAADIKKMVDEQKKLVAGSKEELEAREKITRAEANQHALREGYRKQDKQMNETLDARDKMKQTEMERMMQAYKSGGLRGAMSEGAGMAMANPKAAFGAIAAGVAGIGAAGAYAERFTGYGQRLEAAKGSAIEGSAGQNLRDVYAGRSPFENQFQTERNSAAGLAKQKEDRNRWTDRMKGIGSIGGMALGVGGMIGGGILAAGGTIAAPFTGGAGLAGTALGASMFAGGMATFGAGAAGITNDRTRASLNPFSDDYEKMLAKDRAQDFRSSYEDMKNQDPAKKLGMERFEAEAQRNVQAQRQLGLSNNQFYKGGGFLADVARNGFMAEQGLGMANNIIGAGGSSRMGQNASFGLQMERSGMTNAGGILGTMSGSIQNPEANKRATISIMSEAFKIGLDNTTFAEENRRFAQAAANVIGRTGATSESEQDRLSSVLSQFMGQRTNAGVNEASSAYERMQERGSQTTGRRGTLRFQSAMQDPSLSKMDTSDLTELLSMKPEELNTSNPAVAEFARAAGISPEELIGKVTGKGGVNEAGRFLFPGQKDKISSASDKLNKYMSDNNLSYAELGDQSRVPGALPADIQQALGRTMIEANKSEGGGITAGAGLATSGEFLQGVTKTGEGKQRAERELKGSGRLEDEFMKQAAEGADEARKNFNQMTESLWKVVAGANALTQATAPLAQALSSTAAANNRNLPQGQGMNADIATQASGAQTQPQSNKPKGR